MSCNTLAYLKGLPETNPYRSVLLTFQTLPAADCDALGAWAEVATENGAPAPTLAASLQAHARTLFDGVLSAAAGAPTVPSDWPPLVDPNDPDNPLSVQLPCCGLVRRLVRLTVKIGDTLPPGTAAVAYAAAARLGRQQRAGAALIEQLAGMGAEDFTFDAVARRLAEFSGSELQGLSTAWSALPPMPSTSRAFTGELDLFFRPMIEKIIRPGLRALLAEEAGAGGGTTNPDETEATQPAERRRAANRLRRFFGGPDDSDETNPLLDSMRERAHRHPGNADGYADELLAAYQNRIDAQLADAAPPTATVRRLPPPPDDPFLQVLLPTFASLGRSFTRAAIAPVMLQAAIHHRLSQLGHAPAGPAPADPRGGSPEAGFALEPTPDGGFLLRSRYEMAPGQPLTYKFAAPDAGFVRPK